MSLPPRTLHSINPKECTMAQDITLPSLFARPSTLAVWFDRCLANVGVGVAKPAAKPLQPQRVCRMCDLQEIVIANEVEAQARAQAAQQGPGALPFGLRNPAWKAFKTGLRPGDIVWRFESSTPYGGVLRGYAAVRHQQVVAEFVEGRVRA
jgi:hypothetical protein